MTLVAATSAFALPVAQPAQPHNAPNGMVGIDFGVIKAAILDLLEIFSETATSVIIFGQDLLSDYPSTRNELVDILDLRDAQSDAGEPMESTPSTACPDISILFARGSKSPGE
jgi:hypothetical protein